ncbi:protein mono-ADP-ribosyltransferase PARP12 [Trichomycterus rosablanca]|uniref:protein mono-ADP-ribosyltransferase PARP12 n=1 Tax=Trichomycterus rosablanca TaxID=2290929 RepID=UPI002F360FA8
MAEAAGDSSSEFSDTDIDSQSDDVSSNDSGSDSGLPNQRQVCRYYNKGHCRYGKKCRNQHVCKYFLKDSCQYGANCRLSHNLSSYGSSEQERGRRRNGGRGHRGQSRSSSSDSETDSSKPYRWQLDLGNGWEDVANDHILEAQYSRPSTNGIKIFNTPRGALSIDFTKMRILKKTNLRVRRKGSRHTEWLWYYRGNHSWNQYGEKDVNGKVSSLSSSSLETDFQRDRRGSVQLTVDSTTYEIKFREMCQENLSTNHKRRIRRRPKFVPPQNGRIKIVTKMLKALKPSSSNHTPVWQFSGRGNNWHNFVPRSCCSITSADIEAEYQRNPQGTMDFTVNNNEYKLDFSQMIQVNLNTSIVRKIKRA